MACSHPESAGLLALYRDGKLDPEAEQDIEAHLLACSECFARFVLTVEIPPLLRRFVARHAEVLGLLPPRLTLRLVTKKPE